MNGRQDLLAARQDLGGSSSINGLIYIRGQREDYDHWSNALGLKGWSYDECLPYFIKPERNQRGQQVFNGGIGPLSVSTSASRTH